jgi:predicted phosphodiesterase
MVTGLWMARQYVWIIFFVTACFAVYPALAMSSAENSDFSRYDSINPMGPVVFGTTRNSTVISFMSGQSCTPIIKYANDSHFLHSEHYDHELFSSSYGRNHTMRITDLEPVTKYHYNVSGCGIPEVDRTFRTFPATGSFTFVVYGDTREQAPLYTQTERHKIVADRIAQEKDVLFVVNSGDLVSDSTDEAEWSRFFDATEKLRSMTSYYAIPGNHDTDRVLFGQLFGTNTTTFFDCGNMRIALLDSTAESSMSLEEQAEWIISAFGSHKGGKVAILHYPVYSSDEKHYGGWQNIQSTIVPAFQESGVRVVFNSHVHVFEQVERDGITYITEARGGAPAYPLNKTRIPGSVRAYENTLGYSRVTVDSESEKIRVDVIRVSDVSGDLRTVTRIYPEDTLDAKIRIPLRKSSNRFPDISEMVCMLKDLKDACGGAKSFPEYQILDPDLAKIVNKSIVNQL